MENYEDISMVQQPKNLKINLFPHQLASVYMMEELESTHCIADDMNRTFTNIAINADLLGYGKTLSMIALIVRDKMEWDLDCDHIEETIHTYSSQHIKHYFTHTYPKNNTTLILAGPSIIHQWMSELSYTNLKVTEVSNKKIAETVDIGNYDVVVVSPNMYNILVERWHHIAWKRFIYDEPTTVCIPAMRDIVAGFTWFITATPYGIISKHKKRRKSYMHKIVSDYHFASIIDTLIVKNDDDFVKLSFEMPPTHHHNYECYVPTFRAVNGIVSDKISKMIEAGNISGAIDALGGKHTDNIIELVKKYKEIELEEVKNKIKIWTLKNDSVKIDHWKKREKDIIQQLEELDKRFEKILEENCPICFDKLDKPVMEPSCQNIFCGSCLLSWLTNKGSCPLCRKNIEKNELICIDKKENKEDCREEDKKNKTKEQTIVDLIQNKEEGRFIVFSDWDESFCAIREVLKENEIVFVEIKGSVEVRTKNLERFRKGKVNVVFLNSRTDNSGINMQETTDIILYHTMNEGITKQIIGRANRIGRKVPLYVHHLITN
jgi:SNF2 family DNA or RNA helicase